MRRLATVLGTLATAGIMALTLPATAFAVEGSIVFSPDNVIQNPPGGSCYNVPITSSFLDNNTEGFVALYSGQNCTGDVIASVYPHTMSPLKPFSSVLVL
ncbi:hypothetical protein [Streptomyces sp. NPDC015350]|uniref:hypothetical protein n=1 Tax=Streptomyces sp. NPDC015350 TaxID=3364955 RepID=UPI003702907E